MTEQERADCADPHRLLEFLRDKSSERKLQLFAVACGQIIWHLLRDVWWQAAVETAEQYADGVATSEAVRQARAGAFAASNDVSFRYVEGESDALTATCAEELEGVSAESMVAAVSAPVPHQAAFAVVSADWSGKQHSFQAALFRDIFGNPFRSVAILPAVLSRNDCAIRRIANAIYDDRSFDRLPILADALLEAGCTDAEILGHCQGSGPHVRGCWVVDLLTGRT